MFVAFGFLSLVGTIASLLPAVFSGDRASVSMINHPGRNSHFTQSPASQRPHPGESEPSRDVRKGSERMEVENFHLRSPESLSGLAQSREMATFLCQVH